MFIPQIDVGLEQCFSTFSAAEEPSANVYVARETPEPALASAGPNAKPRRGAPQGTGPMTSLCSVIRPFYEDVI